MVVPKCDLPNPGPWFLFADERVSNTMPREADMTRGTAMISDIRHQPGDGAGFRARHATHAKLTRNS
jgi:hypothetical protein